MLPNQITYLWRKQLLTSFIRIIPMHISLSFHTCTRLVWANPSLRPYSCASSEPSDADSICSCDSSLAIGPRPPFWYHITFTRSISLQTLESISCGNLTASKFLANFCSWFPFLVLIIPQQRNNVNHFFHFFSLKMCVLNNKKKNMLSRWFYFVLSCLNYAIVNFNLFF